MAAKPAGEALPPLTADSFDFDTIVAGIEAGKPVGEVIESARVKPPENVAEADATNSDPTPAVEVEAKPPAAAPTKFTK